MLDRFRGSVARVFDQNVYSTRLRAFYSPMLGFLPSLGLAVVLLRRRPRGDRRRPVARRLHRLLHLPGDADRARCGCSACRSAWRSARSPRATGCSRSSTASRGSPARPDAPPLPDGPGRGRASATWRCATTAASRRSADIDLEVPAGRTVALVGPTGSGKTSLVALIARLYDPTDGRGARSTAPTCASVDVASLRRSIAFVADESFLFSAIGRREHRLRAPRRDARSRSSAAARRAQAHDFITAPARRLRDGGRRARADALGRPAPAGRDRPGADRRAADPDPRRRDLVGRRAHRGGDQARACARRWRAGRRSSSPTASRRSRSPTRSWSWTAGRIVDRGTHEELLERCPLYAEIAEFGCEDVRLPPARPRGARGGGGAVRRSEAKPDATGHRADPRRRARASPRRPRTRPTSRAGSPARSLLLRDLWRLIRGEDQRGAQGALDARPAAPLPQAGVADVGRAGDRDGGGARAAVPRRAGDRRRDQGGRRRAR